MDGHQGWCRKPGLILLLALACVAVSGCRTARLDGVDLTGSAVLACGFDDGPATLVHLQANGIPATWIFNVQGQPPERLGGAYPIDSSGRQGTANLRVCQNAIDCTTAVVGTVVVTGQHHRWIDGKLDYRLPGQESERRTFSASIEKTDRGVCP